MYQQRWAFLSGETLECVASKFRSMSKNIIKIIPGNHCNISICTNNREIVSFETMVMYSRIKTTLFVTTVDFDTCFPQIVRSCKFDPMLNYFTSQLT
jgi:hypothetical protein